MINTTSQLLSRLSSSFSTSAALAPTRRDENVLGYDVDVTELLGIVLQFKRPSRIHHRTLPSRISRSTPAARFESNIQQWLTLLANFNKGQALYAIPPVHSGDELHRALDKTVFVDVHGVLPGTSLLYCPDDCCTASGDTIVEGKIKDSEAFKGPKYRIPPRFVYCWEDVSNGLVEGGVGLQFYELDPDFVGREDIPVTERRRTTEELRDFHTRLEKYAEGDEDHLLDRVKTTLRYWRERHASLEGPQLHQTSILFDRLRDVDALPGVESNRENVVFRAINKVCAELQNEAQRSSVRDEKFYPATYALQAAKAELCMFGDS